MGLRISLGIAAASPLENVGVRYLSSRKSDSRYLIEAAPGMAMNDIRYAEHVNATAVCVELALSGVEADLEKELEASTGRAAEALRRVLDRLRQRQETVAELTKQVH